ncbi:hypothetical protein D9M68_690450 [compost metagenome]
MVDAAHGLVVGPGRVAVDQRGEVVVAGEHLAYALPEPRVQLQHAADMGVGILVVGVEAAEKGVEAPPLLGRQLPHRSGHQHIGGAVPVGTGIVAGVVARALGLVLVPLFGDRDTGDHHVIDASLVHGLQQGAHAIAFLEEVHVMQMGIAVAVVACFTGQGRSQQQCGETGPQSVQGNFSLDGLGDCRPPFTSRRSAWQ